MIDPNQLFAPARALGIADIDLFAGRERELEALLSSLSVTGSLIVLFGDRGVGKTSLARLAFAAADGDARLTHRFADPFVPLNDTLPLWIECDHQCQTIYDVLQKLLLWPERSLGSRLSDAPLPPVEVRRRLKRNDDAEAEHDWDVQATFQDWIRRVRAQNGMREITIFIDEFDRLPDKSHVGELAKNGDGFKFVVVGIGDVIDELVADHRSVARQMRTVRVGPFSADEIAQIFVNAESVWSRNGDGSVLSFNADFVNAATLDSGGFPYLAQAIGDAAVRNLTAAERRAAVVTLDGSHYRRAIYTLFEARQAEITDNVALAVREALEISMGDRQILAAIAEQPSQWVSSLKILKAINTKLRPRFFNRVEGLVEAKILARSPVDPDLLRFESPIKRLLVRLRLQDGAGAAA